MFTPARSVAPRGRGVAGLAAALLAACSQHVVAPQARQIPDSERAVLRVVNYRQGVAAWNAIVESVDGEATPFFFRDGGSDRNFLWDSVNGGPKEVELGPGHRAVEVAFFWDQFLAGTSDDATAERCTLTFEAEPGETYDLASAYGRSTWRQWFLEERDWTAWVVNARTGEVVSTDACTPG